MTSDRIELARKRIRQVFQFLKAFNDLRNPQIRQIEEQPWVMRLSELPQHPLLWLRGRSAVELKSQEAGDADLLLSVGRPDLPAPPVPPALLQGWLPDTWRNPAIDSISPFAQRDLPGPDSSRIVERFDVNQERVRSFGRWQIDRQSWTREVLAAHKLLSVFNRLYELKGRLEREGESVQLLLGEGILLWRRNEGDIRHPIVAQRLQLLFDPNLPEFKIAETDQPPELLTALLVTDQPLSSPTIQHMNEELAVGDVDLLDREKMEGPFRRLAAALDAEGRYFGQETPSPAAEHPQIYCDPVLYLSRRTQGFAVSLDSILQDLRNETEFSSGLMRVTGIDSPIEDALSPSRRVPWEASEEILFTKEANEEQFQIAERLTRHHNVLVQGPPGTGKTHTIANLIGHLLAHGKKVLVTAHTSKALRVLRDKVVGPLQTLCVSLLDDETESRRQLEASVDAMVARLTSDDSDVLDRGAANAQAERKRLCETLSQLHRSLIEGRQDEYREVVVGGAGTSPSEAARFISKTAEFNSWIPGSVESGAPLPLSEDEMGELYLTNTHITADDEVELRRWRPLPGEMPGAEEFGLDSGKWRALQEADRTTGAQFWADSLYEATEEELLHIEDRIGRTVELFTEAPPWKLDAVAAGVTERGDAALPWTNLIERIDRLRDLSQESLSALLDHECTVNPLLSPMQLRSCAREIREFLESGAQLTWVRRLTKPLWRKFLSAARVNGREPRTSSEFAALETFLVLTETRQTLGERWNNQIARRGGPQWDECGSRPEEGAALFGSKIRSLLAWQTQQFSPLVRELRKAGFDSEAFINFQEVPTGEHAELRRLINAVVGPLPAIIAARVNLLSLIQLDRKFRRWNLALFSRDPSVLPASPVLDVRMAMTGKDHAAYSAAYRCLAHLHDLAPAFELRQSLITRLRSAAPRWADALAQRLAPHGGATPPGSPAAAWMWKQFRQELDSRARVSLPELQTRIHSAQEELRRATARLIELRAWSAQCRRVGLAERQALQGWKDIVRRIGKGKGKRTPGLRVEARRTLAKARKAVPVWIMPLSRVAEAFDPHDTRFDVVIVDEASQCDLMGLIAFYLAKEIVVVGDHEQVSPLDVGRDISTVTHLIDHHLPGIPNSTLYDGRLSLYDLARQSFGGVIRLLEHFRCMPEIISFSNAISYNGMIQPLRDQGSADISPAVVPFRVAGVRDNGKVNREEALTVASLLQACLEQPEYREKTFGAVSLLGEEQALAIEGLVRQTSSPGQLETAHFLCGTAAQFQGDERDVVFISLVDSPSDRSLAIRTIDLYRQRFNVAASRARDQLWVVHSLDPTRDLQPGDLRRRLIEHAQDPQALLRQQIAGEARTESEFEKLVLRRLVNAGFRVRPQWPIARYRIDMLVGGDGRRLAVECDGDRFHPLEQVAEDMARQSVIERLGLRFVRIRGSQFFRDPEGAMEPVFEALRKAGVTPESSRGDAGHPPASSDLLERVRRRAAEILREQRDPVPPEGPLDEKDPSPAAPVHFAN